MNMYRETQDTINAWAEQTFGTVDARSAFLRCADEFAEMARALGFGAMASKMMEAVMNARDTIAYVNATCGPLTLGDEHKARIEAADVLITLYRVMECLSGDLHITVDDKMGINRARKWRMTGPGTGQHVKDGE